VLVDLRGFVVRGAPGTEAEQLGVFHQTFAEYLLDPATEAFGIAPEEPHAALVEALDELAPMTTYDPRDPLHQYAPRGKQNICGPVGHVIGCWPVCLRENR